MQLHVPLFMRTLVHVNVPVRMCMNIHEHSKTRKLTQLQSTGPLHRDIHTYTHA
jgi:hypothetical protein